MLIVVPLVLVGIVAAVAVFQVASSIAEGPFSPNAERAAEEFDEVRPPSERDGAPDGTSDWELNRDEFGIVGEDDPNAPTDVYNEISCLFSGTSVMQPPLPFDVGYHGGPHAMSLEPGARFDCADGAAEESAGSVSIDATFDTMSVLSGVAKGTGRIEWERIGPSAGVEPSHGMASNTEVEVELDVPLIIVWTTILDGPYAGYKGRLILQDWEQLLDDEGRIRGVRFAPTSAFFGAS